MAKGPRIINWGRPAPPAAPPKPSSWLEPFQIGVGIIVSIATAFIGWKTFELDEKAKENNTQLKAIEQQLAQTKFGFEQTRDIYDRTEKYLTTDKQDPRRGRALVLLISSLPNSPLRSDLLSLIVIEASSTSVAANAAAIQAGKPTTPITELVVPKVDPNSFFGKVSFRFVQNGEALETLENFGFKDAKGVLWDVPKGTIVSGLAIPRTFWSVVGSPLDGQLAASSALLEYYSTKRTRSKEDTVQMFYESMKKAGVPETKAKLLFSAVRTFGPAWN
jgi:Protein of unknown function (DUF1353)